MSLFGIMVRISGMNGEWIQEKIIVKGEIFREGEEIRGFGQRVRLFGTSAPGVKGETFRNLPHRTLTGVFPQRRVSETF